MEEKIRNIKNEVSDILELPKEVMLDLPKITSVGNQQLIVENHKGIIEYTSNKIRISVSLGILMIQGKNLYIKTIIKEEIIIVGIIYSLEFIE